MIDANVMPSEVSHSSSLKGMTNLQQAVWRRHQSRLLTVAMSTAERIAETIHEDIEFTSDCFRTGLKCSIGLSESGFFVFCLIRHGVEKPHMKWDYYDAKDFAEAVKNGLIDDIAAKIERMVDEENELGSIMEEIAEPSQEIEQNTREDEVLIEVLEKAQPQRPFSTMTIVQTSHPVSCRNCKKDVPNVPRSAISQLQTIACPNCKAIGSMVLRSS